MKHAPTSTSASKTAKPPFIPQNLAVLGMTPIAAAILVPLYALSYGFDWYEWFWFAFFMVATGISITGGYHRLWSHRAYEAHWSLRLFFAIFGACAVQNSILTWSSDHRDHHRHVDDNEKDPYSAGRGFWFSHMGWILRRWKPHPDDFTNVKDLQRDPIVAWQHRHYLAITLTANIALPLLLGFIHGKLWGVFIIATLLRVVLNHHFTFFINSLAHIWGRRPYSNANSARDNDLLALVTYGEGYHNYHHRFQYDYRNGIRWWHFDPTKWMIRSASWVGLTHKLKIVPQLQIERARLAIQFQQALARLDRAERRDDFRARLEEQYQDYLRALNDWAKVKQEWYAAKRKELAGKLDRFELRLRYVDLKYRWKLQRKRWRLMTAQLAQVT